jgi:hypothetical protein
LDSTLNSWSFDLDDLRRRAAQTETVDDYPFVDYDNQAWFLVLSHAARAITQVTVVLGAYFFLHSVGGRSITPHCPDWAKADHVPRYSFRRWEEYTCYFTTACFWTYPIVCPLAIVLLFWTNLLDKRLFYECLFNRVFLQQHSMSYLTSWTFWLLLLHFLCGMCCIFFKDAGEQDKLLRQEMIFGMFAYISSTVAFLYAVFTNWSVNRLVVPLPMFVENDLNGAMDLLKECTFIRDTDFWRDFQAAEVLCAEVCRQRRMSFAMSTPELMRLILDIEKSFQDGTCGIYRSESFLDKICNHASNFYEQHCRPYWVSRFLFFPALQDQRSRTFRLWSRVYYAFMVVTCLLFCYTLVYTLNKLVLLQESLDVELPLPAPHRAPGILEDLSKKLPDMVRDGSEKVPFLRKLVPPVTCSVRDGSAFSVEYPCSCGTATCFDNQACNYATDKCKSAHEIHVSWPCEESEIGSSTFHLVGTTKSGAPWFSNGKSFIYHDPNCDGKKALPRWILNDVKPDTDAKEDLERDGQCLYLARFHSSVVTGPPSGEWKIACRGAWQDMQVNITMAGH